MAASRFPKPEVVLSQPWIEISHRNLAGKYISTFLIRSRNWTWTRKYISDSIAAILKNRYDVITPPPIVQLLRNSAGRCEMACRWHTSKSKREIEFQYGGRPFSETGSSFTSAVNWSISSKFGRQIDLNILKQIASPNLNTEVHFRLYGRYLEKWIWHHNSAADRSITTIFGRQM